MQSIELNLIKMISDHYFIKTDRIIQKIEFRGKNFFAINISNPKRTFRA